MLVRIKKATAPLTLIGLSLGCVIDNSESDGAYGGGKSPQSRTSSYHVNQTWESSSDFLNLETCENWWKPSSDRQNFSQFSLRESERQKLCTESYEPMHGISFNQTMELVNECGKDCGSLPSRIRLAHEESFAMDWVYAIISPNPSFDGDVHSVLVVSDIAANSINNQLYTQFALRNGTYYVKYTAVPEGEGAIPSEKSNTPYLSSGTQKITITSNSKVQCPMPIDFVMDQLKTPENYEVPTNARIRFTIETEAVSRIEPHARVRIELRDSPDLLAVPLETYSFAAERLLVPSYRGKAKFITPQLPKGHYYLSAYIDRNFNEYYDLEELFGYESVGDTWKAHYVIPNRTSEVTLKLENNQ